MSRDFLVFWTSALLVLGSPTFVITRLIYDEWQCARQQRRALDGAMPKPE